MSDRGVPGVGDPTVKGVAPDGALARLALGSGGTLWANLVAGEVVATVGTISQVQDVTGGSLTQMERVRTVGQLEDVQGGSLTQVERARRVGAVEDHLGGSLTQIERVRRVGAVEDHLGGSITQVERARRVGAVESVFGGTITQVQQPRTRTTSTLAANFEVSSAGQGGDVPGTFDVGPFDGFTVMFQPTGADAGTFTVEHQLRAGPGGPWVTDGVDGSIATEHVATVNHKAHQYRPSLGQNHGAGNATLAVQGVGN